jgi:hypothetical protein
MMNNGRKSNRDADDPEESEEEEVVDDGLRKKVIKVICAVVTIFKIFLEWPVAWEPTGLFCLRLLPK